MRRRAMFPPIRPSPIMPICTLLVPSHPSWPRRLGWLPVPTASGEDLGAEARAAHPQVEHVGEAGPSHILGDAPELPDAPELLVGDREPAEPVRFVERIGGCGLEIRRPGPRPRIQHVNSPAMLGPG